MNTGHSLPSPFAAGAAARAHPRLAGAPRVRFALRFLPGPSSRAMAEAANQP